MKRLITFSLLFILSSSLYSQNRLFKYYEKHDSRKKEISQKSKINSKQNYIVSNLESQPTLIKSSNWDMQSNTWLPSVATKIVLSNNLATEVYIMSYDLLDTFSKYTNVYNNSNQLISTLIENKLGPNMWYPSTRSSTNYLNSNGTITRTTIEESYDIQTSSWINPVKYTNTIDDRGNEINVAAYTFDEINNTWDPIYVYSTKITYLNSIDFRTTEVIDSVYDSNSQTMIVDFKSETSYDNNGRTLTIKYYGIHPSTNQLQLGNIDSVFYNGSDIDEIISTELDEFGSAITKTKFADIEFINFNPSIDLFENEPRTYVMYYFEDTQYILVEKYNLSFTDNNGSTLELYEYYVNGMFLPGGRSITNYDNNKNLIEESEEAYDEITNSWFVNNKTLYLYQYDANNNPSEMILQFYDSFDSVMVNIIKYEFSNYELINTNTSDNKYVSTLVYPNPLKTNNLTFNHDPSIFKYADLNIYDLSGKLILNQKVTLNGNSSQISLPELEPGMYFLKVNTETKNYFAKFIKE